MGPVCCGAIVVAVLIGCRKDGVELAPISPDPAAALTTVDPDEVLDTYLQHPQPGLRGQAVRWRAWAGIEGGADDGSSWVQRAEVEGLALRGDDAARARLVVIAGRGDVDPWVRSLAALVHPAPDMQVALASYRTEPVAWRRVPLALGAWAAGDEAARTVLLDDVRTGMLDWNIDLMLAIGAQGDPGLVVALKAAQQNAEPELRLAIAAARLALGDETAAGSFTRVIDGSDVQARLEAVDLLVRVPTDRARRLLERAGSKGPELVTWYVELAGIDRGQTKLSRLARAMESDNPEIRQLAVRFAVPGAAGDPWHPRALVDAKRRDAVAPIVESGLVDSDARVRQEGVRSAAALGLEVGAVAQALVGDSSPQVRIAAAGYLRLH